MGNMRGAWRGVVFCICYYLWDVMGGAGSLRVVDGLFGLESKDMCGPTN